MIRLIILSITALILGACGSESDMPAYFVDNWNPPGNLSSVTTYHGAPLTGGIDIQASYLQPGHTYTISMQAKSANSTYLLVLVPGYSPPAPFTIGTDYRFIAFTFTAADPSPSDMVILLRYFHGIDIINFCVVEGTSPNGALSLSRPPLLPVNDSLSPLNPSTESAGAQIIGQDYVVARDTFDLPVRLTAAEVTQFLTFWRDTVRGMSTPFSYVDARGNVTAVRFAEPTLPQIVERGYDAYAVTAKLRREV